MDKKEIRLKMKKMRADLLPQEREEAAFRVLLELQKLPQWAAAKTLFCYASYGAELPTAEIAAAHPQVAYPKVFPDGKMRFFLGGELKAGYRGIPEPQGGVEVVPQAGDLMLLPGLAFDMKGNRLGYGGGYYDRYLAALKERPICCGICYEEQILVKETLPKEPWDQPLDLLIAPRWVASFTEEL